MEKENNKSKLTIVDNDPVTFWFISSNSLIRGQGKRSKGMIKGGMSARVTHGSRIDTTIAEMKKNFDRVNQNRIRLIYMDIILNLSLDELKTFLDSPRLYTTDIVLKRLSYDI